MSEAEQAAGGNTRPSASACIDDFCNCVRQGVETIVDAVTPPEAACKHFRESRIEFLRGIREIIDHRIDRLSRKGQTGGTKVVVE
jgi:hypothetical protein